MSMLPHIKFHNLSHNPKRPTCRARHQKCDSFRYFPAPIAAQFHPTWYTMTARKEGYGTRTRDTKRLVALTPEPAREDILSPPAGAAAIYEESMNLKQYRDDVICYPVPFDKITASVCAEAKLRKLVKNMVYVGVVAYLLSLDLAVIEKSVKKQFAKKQKVFD